MIYIFSYKTIFVNYNKSTYELRITYGQVCVLYKLSDPDSTEK